MVKVWIQFCWLVVYPIRLLYGDVFTLDGEREYVFGARDIPRKKEFLQ